MLQIFNAIGVVALILTEPGFAHDGHTDDLHPPNAIRTRRAARTLLEKGIEALGGETALKGLTSYSTSA